MLETYVLSVIDVNEVSLGSGGLVSLEGEGAVDVTLSLEELVLEFDPMESDGMKSALHDIHHHQDGHSHGPEGEPHDEGADDSTDKALIGTPSQGETLFEEDSSELRVSKGESPQSEVRGSVGDRSENKLDGLNHLMDEKSAEGVVVLFRDTGLGIEDLLVHLDVVNFVVASILVTGVDDGLLVFRTGLGRLDGIEVVIVVSLMGLAAESVGARLNAEHEGDTDSNEHEADKCGSLLASVEVDTFGLLVPCKTLLTSEGHQVVNHNRNNGGAVVNLIHIGLSSGVGVHRVDPFLDHQEVHVSEKSVQDEEAANDFEDEDESLSSEDGVESLDGDTHAHVEHSDDDGGTHLDGVEEGQGVGVT